MKTLLIAALLSTAALAQAAPDNMAPAGSASVDTQVVSGTRYSVSASEFAAYRGSYKTDDGGSIKVSRHDHKFYTKINGQAPMEMLAAGPDSFVSRDGRTKVDFRQNANGDLMEVAVSAISAGTASVAAR
jgi:hypothetical protein